MLQATNVNTLLGREHKKGVSLTYQSLRYLAWPVHIDKFSSRLMSVSIHFYLLRGLNYQSPNFKRLQIIVNACILLYYISKVYSFCFLFFYFNCSTYVTREQPPAATSSLSRAKLQKINEICNLIPQNIFYRVNFTWIIKGEILVIHNHIILSLLLTQTLNIGKHRYRYYHFSTIRYANWSSFFPIGDWKMFWKAL